MEKYRNKTKLTDLTTGPGKLCEALAITKKQDGLIVVKSELIIEEYQQLSSSQIVARPRIGIPYAEEAISWPLRFYIKDSSFISRK